MEEVWRSSRERGKGRWSLGARLMVVVDERYRSPGSRSQGQSRWSSEAADVTGAAGQQTWRRLQEDDVAADWSRAWPPARETMEEPTQADELKIGV